MNARQMFWLSLALGLSGFAMIQFWTMPRIDAGGLPIPDLHLTGYDLGDMRRFLSALSEAGRAAFLRPQRLADTLFPIGLAGALASAIHMAYRHRSPALAKVLVLLPLAYLVFDLLENAAIAGLLRTEPEALTPEAVARARTFTIWKFRLVGATALVLVIGVVLVVLDKNQERS